jgi:YVTN family beta-propeller protein
MTRYTGGIGFKMRTTACLLLFVTLPILAGSVRIYQTNSAGDDLDVIDPSTNQVVMKIKDLESAHGVAFSPDGARAYITCEADSTVWVVQTTDGHLVNKVPLSGHPNNIAVSNDGRRVFAAIVTAPGAVDVIDAKTLDNVKTIPVKGSAHNVYVTPDGKFVVVGSVVGKSITVIDENALQPAWDMTFDEGVRPIAFERAVDGSTRRMFVQLSNLHGFAVVNFETHTETQRLTLPDEPRRGNAHSSAPSHGIGVSPDGKMLWVDSSVASGVFAYSLPDLKLIGNVATGSTPDWLTFTPDSNMVYVANAGANYVSAVDTHSLKEVARIAVGEVPKRNGTVTVR